VDHDFDGVDINQKIALIFQKLPDWERLDKSSPWWLDRGPGALGRGAVGVIGIEFKDEPIILSQYERNIHPAVLITKSVAEDLLNGSGHSLRDIKQRIDSLRKPFSFPLNKIIEMKVIGQYDRVPTMNVVALLEGSDSLLKNEYVVIGAHLDGQGFPSSDIFLPGANDNASGSAVVLEIARTFVRGKVQPKRSVVFVLFTGEEELSIGSRRFVEDPPIPLNRITSMIEFDCVGYGDSISIRKSAPKLWELTYMEDSIYTRMMSKIINRGPGADAAQFEEKGIPSVYFTTKNSSVHIHSTADLPDTFNQSLFEKITRLAYLTAFQVANGNYDREVVKK
jgi:hypothetical protein